MNSRACVWYNPAVWNLVEHCPVESCLPGFINVGSCWFYSLFRLLRSCLFPTKALNTLSLGSNSSRHFLFCSGRKRFHVFRHIASCQELLFLSPFIHQQEVPKAVADHQHFVDINKLVSADELILFHLYFMNSRKSCRNNHDPPRKYVTFVIEYRSTLNCEKYKCFPAQSYHLEPRVFKEMRKHGKFRKHWKENQSIVPIPQEKRHK